ncbi:hypothetical protein CYMTET_31937 [Cymbomonas tetramitiformis]|uniref:Uncharacterized protein n=1 Tax=Cymbomonas tetramitiformis TaxID=36881 RepID=A0AAE0FFV1_9CHLO|nr:hypothetical protein CYMTET_31937 [Cymbomonas tetramitiformis]
MDQFLQQACPSGLRPGYGERSEALTGSPRSQSISTSPIPFDDNPTKTKETILNLGLKADIAEMLPMRPQNHLIPLLVKPPATSMNYEFTQLADPARPRAASVEPPQLASCTTPLPVPAFGDRAQSGKQTATTTKLSPIRTRSRITSARTYKVLLTSENPDVLLERGQ